MIVSFFVLERTTDQLDHNILMFAVFSVSTLSFIESLSLLFVVFSLCLFDENLIKAVFAKYNGLDQTLDTTHLFYNQLKPHREKNLAIGSPKVHYPITTVR